MRFAFEVQGKPVGQGNMARNRFGGMRHANGAKLQPWRDAIGWSAKARKPPGWDTTGPMAVTATFWLPRPRNHHTAGKQPLLRPQAPWWPVSKRSGDLDHYLRALGDALTGIAWVDDSQIVAMHVHKQWHALGGLLTCTVERLQEGQP